MTVSGPRDPDRPPLSQHSRRNTPAGLVPEAHARQSHSDGRKLGRPRKADIPGPDSNAQSASRPRAARYVRTAVPRTYRRRTFWKTNGEVRREDTPVRDAHTARTTRAPEAGAAETREGDTGFGDWLPCLLLRTSLRLLCHSKSPAASTVYLLSPPVRPSLVRPT